MAGENSAFIIPQVTRTRMITLEPVDSDATWNYYLGSNAVIDLTDDGYNLIMQNISGGSSGYLKIIQNSGSPNAIVWPTGSVFNSGFTQPENLNTDVIIVSFFYDGETFYWNLIGYDYEAI